VHQDHKELRVHRVIKDLPELKEPKGLSVVKVFKVLQVSLPQDHLELRVLKETLETKVMDLLLLQQDHKVLKGLLVVKGLKDKAEDQVQQALKGHRATQELQVEQEQSDHHLTQG
jgi:hypothetical protein